MTPEEIKIEIFRRRETSSVPKIAAALGVTKVTVYRVIDGSTVSRRIMEEIARRIERSPGEVWPQHAHRFGHEVTQ